MELFTGSPIRNIRNYETNLQFGDSISPDKMGHTRFVSANVNGISARDDYTKLHVLGASADMYQIDFLGLIETNLDYSYLETENKCKGIARRYFKQTSIQPASSSVTFNRHYQPGGILSIMAHPWASRCTTFVDPSGMGRWTEHRINGKRNKKVTVITAYTVCHQNANDINKRKYTANTQQWHILKRLHPGLTDIDPREWMLKDLESRISVLKNAGHEIIILIDANDSLQQLNSKLTSWVRRLQLIDIVTERHGTEDEPATHSRGSQRIDYIFTTPTLAEYVSATGILPLHELCFSDHRAIYADIDIKGYLGGELPDNMTRHNREVHSNDPRTVQRFQQLVTNALDESGLETTIKELQEMMPTGIYNDQDIKQKLDAIDNRFTAIVLECEKKSGNSHKLPWSPVLKEANNNRMFWSLWLAQSRGTKNKSFHDIRMRYVNSTTKEYLYMETIDRGFIYKQYKQATYHLMDMKLKAVELRETFLSERAKMAIDGGDQNVHDVILSIKKAEARKRTFSKLKQLKCKTISHGINHIIVENQHGDRRTIIDPEEMIAEIIKQNTNHFSQADGTPFTNEPLKSLIGKTGTSVTAQAILEGNIDINNLTTDDAVDAILRQLQKTLTTEKVDIELSVEDIITGYQKWSEYTSTSPSGMHLSLDKAVLRYRRKQDSAAAESTTTPLYLRYFEIKTFLINSALRTGHVYTRWTKVVNALIEKLPGTPLVTKLRVIHLIESDFNLMIGIIWGRRAVWAGEDNKAFHDGQGGSRPCRRTQELLLHKHLNYSTLRLSKANGASFDNDAKSCFDRIVMPLASLASQQLGVPTVACDVFLGTLNKMKYHVKTIHGISHSYYNTTDHHTIHGPGQGGRGSPAIWVMLSSAIMHCMPLRSRGFTVYNPYNTDEKFTTHMTGFVDDVTHWCSNISAQSERRAIQELQITAQWWEQLLYATGGKLELSKCFFYIMQWDFDQEGIATLRKSKDFSGQVSIIGSEQKESVTIPQRDCSESHKTLGVFECPNGNNSDEWTRLKNKARSLIQRMSTKNLRRYEATLYYFTTFLPSITYGFACGTASKQIMDKIQSSTTPQIISAMGYPRSLPNEVKYGPIAIGGVGMRHLFIEQGLEKCSSIIRYLRCERPVSHTIRLYLLWAQLVAGTSKSILVDVATPLPQLKEELWLCTTREYLYLSRITISYEELEQDMRQCKNDEYIMDVAQKNGFKNIQIERINRCRIFLKCITISDIADATGKKINTDSYNCSNDAIMYSKQKWPRQPRPGKDHLKIWREFIRSLCKSTSQRLLSPLGRWKIQNIRHRRHTGAFVNITENRIYVHRLSQQWSGGNTIAGRYYQSLGDQRDCPPLRSRTNLIPAELNGPHSSRLVWRGSISPATLPTAQDNSWTTYIQTINKWENGLLQHVTLKADVSTVISLLSSRNIILQCVSDGGLKNNIGSFGWVIAHDGQHIVEGFGNVPGYPLSSQRTEGVGKLSWITWVLHFCIWKNINIQCTIESYCDNLSVVTKSPRSHDYSKPSHTTTPNFDVFKSIYLQQQQIPAHVLPNTTWIKGHQDSQTPIDELSIAAQLNIYADQLATTAMTQIESGTMPSIEYVFPAHIASLNINSQIQSSNEIYNLRWRYSEFELQDYYKNRLGLTTTEMHSINWAALRIAREKLSQAEYTFSVKQLIGWLPSGTKLRQYGQLATACSLCNEIDDTNDHMWMCNSRRHLNKQVVDDFKEFLVAINTDTTICEILTYHVRQHFLEPNLINPQFPDKFSTSIKLQSDIGWKLVIRGVMINDWAYYQEQLWMATGSTKLGDSWSAAITSWWIKKSRAVWTQRNDLTYTNTTVNEPRIAKETYAQVRQLYDSSLELARQDRELFSIPIEEFITQPWQFLQTWVETATITVKACKEAYNARRQQTSQLSASRQNISSRTRQSQARIQAARNPTQNISALPNLSIQNGQESTSPRGRIALDH